jgi:hypothetical protein
LKAIKKKVALVAKDLLNNKNKAVIVVLKRKNRRFQAITSLALSLDPKTRRHQYKCRFIQKNQNLKKARMPGFRNSQASRDVFQLKKKRAAARNCLAKSRPSRAAQSLLKTLVIASEATWSRKQIS